MKRVRVTWLDSCGMARAGWKSREDVEGLTPDRIKSVGYVVDDAKGHLTIAAHVASHCLDGIMCIPRSAILKVKQL